MQGCRSWCSLSCASAEAASNCHHWQSACRGYPTGAPDRDTRSKRQRLRAAPDRRAARPRPDRNTAPKSHPRTRTRRPIHARASLPAMPAYAELQVTSNYSFLRGASHIEELFAQASLLRPAGPRHHRPQLARRHRPSPPARPRHRRPPGCRLPARPDRRPARPDLPYRPPGLRAPLPPAHDRQTSRRQGCLQASAGPTLPPTPTACSPSCSPIPPPPSPPRAPTAPTPPHPPP